MCFLLLNQHLRLLSTNFIRPGYLQRFIMVSLSTTQAFQTRRRALKAYHARRRIRLRSKMSPSLRKFLMILMLIVCPLLFAHVAQACTPNCGQPSSGGPLRPVVGIDLGTTYSVVGVMKDEKLHIVRSSQNSHLKTFCSYLQFIRYRTTKATLSPPLMLQ